MMEWTRERLGDLLLKWGLVTEAELEAALEIQAKNGGRLGRILANRGVITEEQLAQTLAEQKNLTLIDLSTYDVDPSVARLVPAHVARRHQVLPVRVENDRLVVAMANPLDIEAVDALRVMTGYDVQPVVATEGDVSRGIRKYLESEDSAIAAAAKSVAPKEPEPQRISVETEDVPVVNLVNKLIVDAIDERASDVHIEPLPEQVIVRYRIDGVLHEAARIPKSVEPALVSRLKIMGECDIAERRLPQDGRFRFRQGGRDIDVRMAVLPTVNGENVSLRLLSRSHWLLQLSQLGFEDDVLDKYRGLVSKPYGAILVTGPTGSGKTTTMYAALNEINTREKKIVTIEDPVEYQISGILQTQVNLKAGLTFPVGLRSLVRCDPDIVLIGEIRDLEAARIAVRSALTGHLVLSSLHANDAPSALTTLIDMGVQPFVISSAVIGVLAQRLARRLCERCRQAYEPDVEYLAKMGLELEPGEHTTFFKAMGCKHCANTGFSGRIGIFELMIVSESVATLCVSNGSTEAIREVAVAEGLRLMRDDGFMKVKKGITTLEEVLRVVV